MIAISFAKILATENLCLQGVGNLSFTRAVYRASFIILAHLADLYSLSAANAFIIVVLFPVPRAAYCPIFCVFHGETYFANIYLFFRFKYRLTVIIRKC